VAYGGIIGGAQGGDDHFVIEGDATRYQTVLSRLKREAFFLSSPAPEIAALLQKRQHEFFESDSTALPTVAPARKLSSERPQAISEENMKPLESSAPKLHIAIGAGWSATGANNDIYAAFEASGFSGTRSGLFGTTIYPFDRSNVLSWHLGADFNLTNEI
jgi:hypothetical protein